MDAILNLYKPAGPTSHDLVAAVRRLSKQRRVGHAGTLDPAAAGVLVVCLGQATRLIEYMAGDDKEYLATVTLGWSTDTYDATGRPTSEPREPAFGREEIERALVALVGKVKQAPPAFSAIKVDGQPLYRAARAGKAVAAPEREVSIYSLDLLAWDPPDVTLYVRCSKGTYVRSIANDLGRRLGCGGHLKHLVRTASGAHRLEDATTLQDLAAAFGDGYVDKIGFAPDEAVRSLPAMILSNASVDRLRNGSPRQGPVAPAGTTCRVYTTDGRLAALLVNEDGTAWWRPRKVLTNEP